MSEVTRMRYYIKFIYYSTGLNRLFRIVTQISGSLSHGRYLWDVTGAVLVSRLAYTKRINENINQSILPRPGEV